MRDGFRASAFTAYASLALKGGLHACSIEIPSINPWAEWTPDRSFDTVGEGGAPAYPGADPSR
jgi:hypothetical protein